MPTFARDALKSSFHTQSTLIHGVKVSYSNHVSSSDQQQGDKLMASRPSNLGIVSQDIEALTLHNPIPIHLRLYGLPFLCALLVSLACLNR